MYELWRDFAVRVHLNFDAGKINSVQWVAISAIISIEKCCVIESLMGISVVGKVYQLPVN